MVMPAFSGRVQLEDGQAQIVVSDAGLLDTGHYSVEVIIASTASVVLNRFDRTVFVQVVGKSDCLGGLGVMGQCGERVKEGEGGGGERGGGREGGRARERERGRQTDREIHRERDKERHRQREIEGGRGERKRGGMEREKERER